MYVYLYVYIYAYAHMYIYIPQLVHARLCNDAAVSLSWKLLRVLREHRAGCHFRPPSCPFVEPASLLLAVAQPVRLRNTSKSTLAHDAVAAVLLHKHHLTIRVGAGLIQFVYG